MAKSRLLAFSGFIALSSVLGLPACGSSDSEQTPSNASGMGGADAFGGQGGHDPIGTGGTVTPASGGATGGDASPEAYAGGGASGEEHGGAAGDAGAYPGDAGGAEDQDAGQVGPQCPGIILDATTCDTEGLTCPNPCMDPCSCKGGVWSCAELCTCPDSNAHTADPCMSANTNCQFPITGTGDDAPYACMCQASNGYAMRWICRDKTTQQPLCPEIPANWNCIDLGLSSCVTPTGSCSCDAEGVFVCTP